MAHSSKPPKPYPEFPLYAHATGRWAKTVRGHTHYFGAWDNWQAALDRWLKDRDALLAGRTPRLDDGRLTVEDLADHFMTAKDRALAAGNITRRTHTDYFQTCRRLVAALHADRPVDDLRPEDFAQLRAGLAKRLGPVAIGNEIQRVRTVFKYGAEASLLQKPAAFGPEFRKPPKKVMRQARRAAGRRLFTPAILRSVIAAASIQFRPMILLGINCGFGNADCGTLPLAALDLDGGWHNYARPKTGIERRCPLWPETVDAIRAAIARRPTSKDDANSGLVFITKYGQSWHKDTKDNPITFEMRKLLRRTNVYRPGLNFYALRHTFETVAGESADQVAVDHIMGHARDDMASLYREAISARRLRAITDRVRRWLRGQR